MTPSPVLRLNININASNQKMAAAQSRQCLISGCYPAQAPWLDRFKSGFRFGQGRTKAASRPDHRRGFHAAAIMSILLSGCGSINCDLLGSDSLRDECQDGIIVKVYSIPTWMPTLLPQTTLRELWQADERAE